ncbi:HAD family hydrolase [Priestia abyssalis]|uniref:HAD family hydrolase n=1 Tax=Priestia abyssalis TaxID=1221450 RepID=UPI0009957AE6|nr:HAD family phosphatase [Priestia abyssalis]
MKKLAVIFDMDGVIVDSEPIYRSLNEEIFKELKIQVDETTKLSFMGGTTKRKWTILKEKFLLSQSVEELIHLQNSIFSQKGWDFKQILFSEAIPLLKSLKDQGIPTVLATSSDKTRVQAVLDQCELRSYFNEIVCGVDFERGKPNPDIFLHAAEKLGISATNCVVIEDSYNGLTAAKRANMYCIGVRHKLINMDLSQADRIVDSLSEVQVAELKGLF